jgi:hypothetical protein
MDTGWYVPQPFGDRFSLELDDQPMPAITAERVMPIAGPMPQSEWSDRTRMRLDQQRSGKHNTWRKVQLLGQRTIPGATNPYRGSEV